MVLQQGPTGRRFLIGEVPLYPPYYLLESTGPRSGIKSPAVAFLCVLALAGIRRPVSDITAMEQHDMLMGG